MILRSIGPVLASAIALATSACKQAPATPAPAPASAPAPAAAAAPPASARLDLGAAVKELGAQAAVQLGAEIGDALANAEWRVVPSEPPPVVVDAATGARKITWRTAADDLGLGVGASMKVLCPVADRAYVSVYGSSPYTADSGVCQAAVHAGKLTREAGGVVTVVLGGALDGFRASEAHGVRTSDWWSYPLSFTLE